MKKNYLFVLTALVSFVFFSCEDKTVVPGDETTTQEVAIPTTSAEAAALVNAIYGPLQTLSSSYSFFLESATETTVCFEEKDETKDGPQVSIIETEASNWYAIKIFNRLYSSISAANTAIDRIEKADSEKVSTSSLSKETLIARAQFIRGYNYFQLVQFFGEVPIVTAYQASDIDKQTRKSIDDVILRQPATWKLLLQIYRNTPQANISHLNWQQKLF